MTTIEATGCLLHLIVGPCCMVDERLLVLCMAPNLLGILHHNPKPRIIPGPKKSRCTF